MAPDRGARRGAFGIVLLDAMLDVRFINRAYRRIVFVCQFSDRSQSFESGHL
jgi:hypothetical protein